ncbi:MAG: type II secretion system protein M [Proteobacteria bacterium]|nr:type II secretion system protein M [Pseudomonadota bacterium]
MKFNYDTLSEREQKMVKFGAIALVAILLFGVLMPLDSSVAKARTRITKKQQDLVWMKGVAPFLAAQAGSMHQNNGESLIVIVDRSARESGLGKSLAGTDPSGAGGIQVRLEKAPFDAIIGWLSRLSQQNGIGVEGATIDGAGAPGVVNAAIVLKPQ